MLDIHLKIEKQRLHLRFMLTTLILINSKSTP